MPRVQRCPAGHISTSRSPTADKIMSSCNKSSRAAADPPIHGTLILDNDKINNHQETMTMTFTTTGHNRNHSNKMEIIEQVATMESYPALEAKPTRTTFAETFSSGGEDEYFGDNYENHPQHPHHPNEEQQQHPHDGDDGGGEYLTGVNHTFSTEEDYPHGVPDLGASFINLAEEAAAAGQPNYQCQRQSFDEDEDDNGRDDYLSNRLGTDSTYSSGDDFINLAQEAAAIPSRHFRTTTMMHQDEFEEYAQHTYGIEEEEDVEEYHQHSAAADKADGTTLQFVDSEDDKAFSFCTRTDHARLATTVTYENSSRHYRTTDDHSGLELQESVSLEATSIGYETCSRTLNTNLETLHPDLEGVNYIPTLNEHEVIHDSAYPHDSEMELHGDVADGESYDDDEQRLGGGGGGGSGFEYDHHGAVGVPIAPNASYLYEDDGYVRHPNHHHQHHHHNDHDDSGHDNMTEFTRDTGVVEPQNGEGPHVLSQIMDSYLSDRSSASSWDEGSYASASRTVSRLDSFDGTEFTEDTRRGNATLMGILKNFRDMNVRDRCDGSDSDDEDDEEDGGTEMLSDIEEEGDQSRRNSRSSRSRRRSTKRDLTSVLGQIGAVGMDLLNETIEQSQQGSRSSSGRRRRRNDQAGNIMDSLKDIFNCGAPSRY